MEKVNVSGTIQASANEVWKLVSNFGELNQFVEAVETCEADGSGAGTVRTLTLQDGAVVKEKLESLDSENRVLTYTIEESPMPISNYTGTMKVERLNDNQSEFTWSSEFDVPDESADEMKTALQGLYSLGVEGLQQSFS